MRLVESIHPVTNLKYWALVLSDGKEVGLDPLVFRILHNKSPILVIDGGRKSGKSWAVGQASVLKAAGMAMQYGHQPPYRAIVIRQNVNSLEDSVMNNVWGLIDDFQLQDQFKRTRNKIRHVYNKSEWIFRGLKQHTKTSIRSFVNFNECWVEEGQELDVPTWEDLEPTIRRKGQTGKKGRFVISMNRTLLTDAIDLHVIQKVKSRTDATRIHRNFVDNPFLDEDDLEEIKQYERLFPDRYPHIYLGLPDAQGHLPLLINTRMVTDCFQAYRKFKDQLVVFAQDRTVGEGGLDLAAQGENFNCLAIRRGPVVTDIQKWNKAYDHETYRRVYGHCTDVGCGDVWYDGSGVGAGFTSRYAEAKEEHWQETRHVHYPLKCIPENNGGAVQGKEKLLARGITNEGQFQYRGDQMAQMLVIRMQNTQRLMDGEDVPLENCLFFSDRLSDVTKSDLMRTLTQPTIIRDKRNRMHVQKMDKTKGQESPDEFDALRLAFARDSANGISMKRWK